MVSCFEVKIYMRSLVGLGPGDGGTPSAGLPDLLGRALSRPWLSGVKSPPLFARLPLGTARQRGPAARCTPHLHIQVSSGIQQHLNHCLVPTDAGVHQGGHALRWVKNQRMKKVYQVTVSLDENKRTISLLCRRLCLLSKASMKQINSPRTHMATILRSLKTKMEARREHKLPLFFFCIYLGRIFISLS